MNFNKLEYHLLVQLGELAAEALALSRFYDHARTSHYCALVAACNTEMLARVRAAALRCGTAAGRPLTP